MSKPKKFEFNVCKPCWELKYCPYGPYVEHFPLSPSDKDIKDIKENYFKLIEDFRSGKYQTEDDILSAIDALEFFFPPRWESIKQYDTSELECTVFGHVCPVFFNAEPFTETKLLRRRGRYIPREIMLKVVRRDGQTCQICHKNVLDNELEFDHIIPHSKGGPVSVENLRVLCVQCNSSKGDTLDEILREQGDIGDWISPPGSIDEE